MVVCRFFLEGRCKYGDRCFNDHPRGNTALSFILFYYVHDFLLPLIEGKRSKRNLIILIIEHNNTNYS